MLLFFVCLHADFTGRLLKWTTVSYWSGIRVLETLTAVPVYGWFLKFIVGGSELTEMTLLRYYILHIATLPTMMLVLIYLHFSTVRRVGLSDVAGERTVTGATFYRNHMATLGIVLAFTFGVLGTLAVLVPLPFHGQADLLSTVPGVRPPWYLLAPFGLRELASSLKLQWAGGIALLLACVMVLALPFLEGVLPRPMRRPIIFALGILGLACWVLLSFYGAWVA